MKQENENATTFKILGCIKKCSRLGTQRCTLFELPESPDIALLEVVYEFASGGRK